LAHAESSTLPPEIGYNYGENESPRTGALGGAVRAFSNSIDALYGNPANMASSRVYHLGGHAQFWPQASRQTYTLAAVDSLVSQSHLAGGFGVSYTRQDPDGLDRSALDVRLALAYPFSSQFYLGGTARYFAASEEGYPNGQPPPSYASGGLENENIAKNFTFSGGLTLKPADEFAIAIVGNNLTDPDNGYLPLSLGGGIGYGTQDFTIEADVLSDFTTYDSTKLRAAGGFEFLAGDHFPLRLGYQYDQGQESHSMSGGAGYVSREFAFDVGVRQTVNKPSSTSIFVGFKYHFEATGIGGGGDF
jgi:hypothetical protein